MTTDLDFARKLVADGKPVLHTKHCLVGVPMYVFAPGEYVDDRRRVIDCVVLRFDDGNDLVLLDNQAEFVQLEEHEHAIHQGLMLALRQLSIETLQELRANDPKGERMSQANLILLTAVEAQRRALAP